MHVFYFTFGQSHVNNNGDPLTNGYVSVNAESHEQARSKFIEGFASDNLPRITQWSFQYSQDEWSNSVSKFYDNNSLIKHIE